MLKIGITGGMGCGKSTVVDTFRTLGVSSFVADKVAAEYYRDAGFLKQLRSLFGDAVFLPDGSADKRRIASIVFSDPAMLARLNALVHPRVMLDFDAFCAQHAGDDYVLFESAILYDYGFDRMMDAVVCVYLDLEQRLQRLTLRDCSDRDTLMMRIRSQMPAEEMMRRADYVILNYEGNPRLRQVAYFDSLIRMRNSNPCPTDEHLLYDCCTKNVRTTVVQQSYNSRVKPEPGPDRMTTGQIINETPCQS